MKKVTLPEIDKDQIVTIGNKPDYIRNEKGEEIRTEPYLKVILDKLIRHKKIWIQVMNSSEKLGRLQEYFELLKYYAVVEINNRKMITEPHRTNPNKKFQYMLICWEIHPKLVVYREIEIYRKMKSE